MVTRTCSVDFVNASKRLVRVDGYPTIIFPKATVTQVRNHKLPARRVKAEPASLDEELDIVAERSYGEDASLPTTADIGVQTTECFDNYYQLKQELS